MTTATAERTAVVRTNGEIVASTGALMPAASIEQMVDRYNAVCDFARRVMRPGHDYGVIPGTERKPPKDGEIPSAKNNTLLKPGAEKLCTLFGLTPDFQEDKALLDFDRGLFLFSYRCILLRHARQEIIEGKAVITGDVVGTGIGSTNSREKKFRRDGKVCPKCGKPAIIKGKEEYGGGWLCWPKKDGCNSKFADDSPEIVNQGGKTSPDDSADQVNNMQKMACKRALVAAVLIATNASELFTQDMEEIEPDGRSIEAEIVDAPPPQQRPAKQAKPKAASPADGAEFEARVAKVDDLAVKEGATKGDVVKAVQQLGIAKGWGERLDFWPAAGWEEGGKLARSMLVKLRQDNDAQAKAGAAAPSQPTPAPSQQPAAPSQPAEPNRPAPAGSSKVGPLSIGALERELARVGSTWADARLYAGLPEGTRISELTLTQHADLMSKLKTLADKK